MAKEIPVDGEGQGSKKPGGGEAERAVVRQVASLQLGDVAREAKEAEARLKEKLRAMCDEKLPDKMDVSKGAQEFEFPYIENGEVLPAPGQMSKDEINIGGKVYKINVRNKPIKLMAIEFKKGKKKGNPIETKMDGVAEMTGRVSVWPLSYISSDKAKVDTQKLYNVLDKLRRGDWDVKKDVLDAVLVESITETELKLEIEFIPIE